MLLDRAVAGYHHVRGDHHVILDLGVMTDVVAAPHHHVVADLDERLNRVVLEDEAVVAAQETWPGGRLRADIADEPIAALLGLAILLGAIMAHLLEAHRN